MQIVKYYMIVCKEGQTDSWEEEMEDTAFFASPFSDSNAVTLARQIITFFNNSLRSGEMPRELLGVKKKVTETTILKINFR